MLTDIGFPPAFTIAQLNMPLEEGLATCLYRLLTSERLSDMAQLFG